jgi:UDP-N-acetylmuramoylalanine--D-glutamate ligase
MDGYVAAKRRIFRDRPDGRRTQTAIVGVDDPRSTAIRDGMAGRDGWNVISISATQRLERGVFVRNGALHDAIDDDAWCVCDLTGIPTLPGAHNWQNAAAAYAAARAVGVAPDAAAAAMTTYPGLPHRMERVATIGGILYVNDSKATNADAAARALACYKPIYWIAGGQAKGDGLDAALPFAANIRHAFLIGDAEAAFAAALKDRVPATRCGALADAVREAHRMAQQERLDGAVVLLSPACASFDQFRNFEERGDVFRALVRALEAEATP